ncbi:unnamed protein product [Polarella glacialis]|uniref:Uncharacterized protein n=1 Tax=Polarella glacialis TaxID=89957 RepID=A0A813I6D3_POLGL|nr:unnamed protein product [Polarella glacialis]
MSFGSNSSNPSSSMSSGSPIDNLSSKARLLKQLEQEFQKYHIDNNNSPGVADAGHDDDNNNNNNDNHNDNHSNHNDNNNDNNNNKNLLDCSATASREGFLACEKTKLCLRLASATKVHCWKAADLPTLGVAFLKQEICGSTHCAKAIADHSELCVAHPILWSESKTLSMPKSRDSNHRSQQQQQHTRQITTNCDLEHA